MIHHPPPYPPPSFSAPAAVVTVNTAYFDPSTQNVFVHLKGIKGSLFVNACGGRAMHVAIGKIPEREYGTVSLQCKGDKHRETFYLK